MFEVDYILNNHNKNDVKRELTKVIDIGIDFKCQDNFAERRFPSNQIEELLKTPTKGMNLDELIESFKKEILPYCSNFSTANFMGFPDAGNSIAGLSGAILSDLLQQNLINSKEEVSLEKDGEKFCIIENAIYYLGRIGIKPNIELLKEKGKLDYEPLTKIFDRILKGSYPILYNGQENNLENFYSAYIKTYILRTRKSSKSNSINK